MIQQKPDNFAVTQTGYDTAKQELARLEKYREEVLVRLQAAREMGDLSENGAYTAARFELSDTDRNLRKMRYIVLYGTVTKPTRNDVVQFGHYVTVETQGTKRSFRLVSAFEADPKKELLSVESPLGQACLGKKVGEVFAVDVPAGKTTYKLLRIEPA